MLEAPFTSARDMAGRMPLVGLRLFWRTISRVHYETVDRVTKLDVPVHVVHGERDVIIPVAMGRAVYVVDALGWSLVIVESGILPSRRLVNIW